MRIQLKRAQTQAEWLASTFILANGEPGVAIDTGAIRIGNGVDTWANLPAPSFAVSSVNTRTGAITLTKTDVGLDQVDNTADLAKPISAAQAAVNSNLQSQIEGLSASGGVTKETIGLGNVDNTSDINKPISTSTQIALNTKAPVNNPVFTGNVQGITKSMVGLAQVDNTSDISKPISAATQAALDTKASSTDPRFTNTRTPTAGSVTDASVASNAGISMDKVADSATRVAISPTERSSISGIASTLNNIHNGVITAGTGALAGLSSPPANSSIVAVGTNSLTSATDIVSSVAVGGQALSSGTSQRYNIAIGENSLQSLTNGIQNIAFGYKSGIFTDTNTSSVAIGTYAGATRNMTKDVSIGNGANTGIVFQGLSGQYEYHGALNTTSTAQPNIAIGNDALGFNTNGTDNVAVGSGALKNLTDSNGNLAIGSSAMASLGSLKGPSGKAVVVVNKNGTYAWSGVTLTISVVAHGVTVGDIVTIKLSGGTFISSDNHNNGNVRGIVASVIDSNSFTITNAKTSVAIQSLTDAGNVSLVSYERSTYSGTDSSNLAVGANAGGNIASGTGNIFVGANSGPTTSGTIVNNMLAVGASSLNAIQTADNVVAFGFSSGAGSQNATRTVFVGNSTSSSTTVTDGVVVGHGAGVTGNTAVSVGSSSTAGLNGVAVGYDSSATTGVAIGSVAVVNGGVGIGNNIVSTGTNGVVIGNSAHSGYHSVAVGDTSVSADNGVAIGDTANAGLGGIAIGQGVVAPAGAAVFATTGHNTTINGSTLNLGTTFATGVINIGAGSTTTTIGASNTSGTVTIRGQLVTIDDAGSTSDERDKTDIRHAQLGLDFINSIDPVEYRWARRGEKTEGKRFHQGVLAQQVKEAADRAGVDFGGYVDQKINGGPDKLLVRYDEFVAPLINAVHELSDKVDWLESRLNGEEW